MLDVFCEPDLMRLQGELLLARGDQAAARATFMAGLEMARAWQARSFELRLTISLARLLVAEGDTAAARGVLQPLVAAFASERAHADVREANELLKRIAV